MNETKETWKPIEGYEGIIRNQCVRTIYKIAKALGVSIETIAGYDERG